jgi:hypothetical protein
MDPMCESCGLTEGHIPGCMATAPGFEARLARELGVDRSQSPDLRAELAVARTRIAELTALAFRIGEDNLALRDELGRRPVKVPPVESVKQNPFRDFSGDRRMIGGPEPLDIPAQSVPTHP